MSLGIRGADTGQFIQQAQLLEHLVEVTTTFMVLAVFIGAMPALWTALIVMEIAYKFVHDVFHGLRPLHQHNQVVTDNLCISNDFPL